jgi:biopolymer transport protein ExbD
VLNEQILGNADAGSLSALQALLSRYRQGCDANRSKAQVTLLPDSQVRHEAIVRVMDACAGAGLEAVSFGMEAGD